MKYTRDIVLTVLGYAFIAFGVMGLFLPFLQGILFVFIGLYLLSIGSPRAHNFLQMIYVAFKARFPCTAVTLEKIERKWEDTISRWRSH